MAGDPVNRQKIIFLIVLGAVGLFIASIVASMFATKQALPNGYELSVGGKGETWVQSADRKTLVTDVTSVWSSPDRMLIEHRTPDTTRPHSYLDCDYLVAEGRGVPRPISKADALAMASGLKRQAASSKTCVQE